MPRFTLRRFFSIFMLAMLLAGSMATSALTATFKDIDGPYKEAILWINGRGAMLGYNPTTFGTNDPLLREQAAAVLGRLRDWEPSDTTSCFRDLAGRDQELARWVCRLYEYEVMNGTGDGLFKPAALVSQLEMIVLVTRTMLASGLWPPSTPDLGVYPNIQGPMRDALVIYVHMAGPVSGSPDIYGNLNNPNAGISRGFAAQIIFDGFQNCGYVEIC